MRIPGRVLLLASALLSACASTSQNGRAQLSVPASVSAVYSDFDMHLKLAMAAVAESSCSGMECRLNTAFDKQVQRLGARLADAAFAAYPGLRERFDHFEFIVTDNDAPGSASSAAGTVAIFRGVQQLRFSEEALGFVIAREMGHIIDGHHDENSAASILFSVLAQLALPMANLVLGASLASGNAVAATTATTAASLAGASALRASNKPEQLREADILGLELLASQGWYGRDVADAMAAGVAALGDTDWSNDLRVSALRIDALTQGPEPDTAIPDELTTAAPALRTAAAPHFTPLP